MAAQSMVDFVKDAIRSYDAQSSGVSGPPPGFRPTFAARDEAPQRPAARIDETRYVSYAARLIPVLGDQGPMTARDAFDATGTDDFPLFQAALVEMTQRGLIHISGRDPKYDDELYALSAPSPG